LLSAAHNSPKKAGATAVVVALVSTSSAEALAASSMNALIDWPLSRAA
jgi:uncharacterized ferredoxin-like protein